MGKKVSESDYRFVEPYIGIAPCFKKFYIYLQAQQPQIETNKILIAEMKQTNQESLLAPNHYIIPYVKKKRQQFNSTHNHCPQ